MKRMTSGTGANEEKVRELMREIEVPAEAGSKMEELKALFEETVRSADRQAREIAALMGGAKAILRHQGFPAAARAIFDHCRHLIGARSGYVALLDEAGAENEVLFLESGGLPCSVDPDLPMPIRGLRAEAYHRAAVVYDNDFALSDWMQFMPPGHVELTNVMFAPLVLEERAIGLIGLANKPSPFTEEDARMAAAFGELAAIALQNSLALDERVRVEEERKKVIAKLREAISQVRALSGLLPICSQCKKIRDDQGYWNQIEQYISEHADVDFTHGICPECVRALYPELVEETASRRKP